jgi:TetR/AcrR family transcriptional regulator, cholesterol catabolism regulator
MAKIKRNRNGTRKDVIIAKAAKLFREKGFSATSMRDLAEHVGVEAASLYNHISSKAEILQEICFKVATSFLTHIEEIEASDTNAIDKIIAVLRFHIRQMVDNYEEVYVSDREWKHLTDPYLSNMQNQRRAYRQRMASLIEAGKRNNEIRDIDAPTVVLIMLHAVSGIESWHRSKKKIPAETLEDNMVIILIEGLRRDK